MTEIEAHGLAFENGRKVGDAEGYARVRKEAFAGAGDLISRKALIGAIVNTPSKVTECHGGDVLTALADRQNEVLNLVEKAPAIAVELVKPGKWKSIEGCIACLCSSCGYTTDYDTTRYCPNCGARMESDGDG